MSRYQGMKVEWFLPVQVWPDLVGLASASGMALRTTR